MSHQSSVPAVMSKILNWSNMKEYKMQNLKLKHQQNPKHQNLIKNAFLSTRKDDMVFQNEVFRILCQSNVLHADLICKEFI